MKKSIMQKWVKALRSGKYKQGQGTLRNENNEFCCLGVLCDLYRKEKKRGWSAEVLSDEGFGDTPSDRIVDWAGMYQRDPLVNRLCLSRWNDERKYTFSQIADLIEQNYEAL